MLVGSSHRWKIQKQPFLVGEGGVKSLSTWGGGGLKSFRTGAGGYWFGGGYFCWRGQYLITCHVWTCENWRVNIGDEHEDIWSKFPSCRKFRMLCRTLLFYLLGWLKAAHIINLQTHSSLASWFATRNLADLQILVL